MSQTIFDISRPGRMAASQAASGPVGAEPVGDLPQGALRDRLPGLPEVSELQVVRHYTNLSAKNFSIDNQW